MPEFSSLCQTCSTSDLAEKRQYRSMQEVERYTSHVETWHYLIGKCLQYDVLEKVTQPVAGYHQYIVEL